jgi:Zn finger protein HypA/HybF involved in hydrogenase expression
MKKLEVEVTCPGCEAVFLQGVAEMRPGAVRQCPHCGSNIHFTGDDGADVQKALDDVEKTFKNLFRK